MLPAALAVLYELQREISPGVLLGFEHLLTKWGSVPGSGQSGQHRLCSGWLHTGQTCSGMGGRLRMT